MKESFNLMFKSKKAFYAFVFFIISPGLSSFAGNQHSHLNTPALGVPVRVAMAKRQPMPTYVQALGTLKARQQVVISSEVDGRIAAINFKSGQEVSKGMPIIQLDNLKAQADYQSAVTALKLSRKNLARGKALRNMAISEQDLETLEANVAKDEALVQSAQATLNQKEITAPFAGVLSSFSFSAGDFVSAGSPIVNLVDATQLLVDYSVPQQRMAQVKKNQPVKISSNAYPNKIFYGTVSYISPLVDQATRTVSIEALLPNDQQQLKPGMFVQVAQEVATNPHAIVVPIDAVVADVQGYHVFSISDNRAVIHAVTLGSRSGGLVEIVQGLVGNESVVIEGQQKLDDGALVNVLINTTDKAKHEVQSKT